MERRTIAAMPRAILCGVFSGLASNARRNCRWRRARSWPNISERCFSARLDRFSFQDSNTSSWWQEEKRNDYKHKHTHKEKTVLDKGKLFADMYTSNRRVSCRIRLAFSSFHQRRRMKNKKRMNEGTKNETKRQANIQELGMSKREREISYETRR